MKRRQRHWRSPDRRPVPEINEIVGVVWSVPLYEIAEAVIPEIEKKLDQDKLTCRQTIKLYAFFSVEDKEGPCVILLGLGTMFALISWLDAVPAYATATEAVFQNHREFAN